MNSLTEKDDSYLLSVLKRTKSLLDSYCLYNQQLETDFKRLKRKYNEAVTKIKRY